MSRAPGLDLLRAIAIVWVICDHALVFGVLAPDNQIGKFGWMGVDLFFALSGFLIGGQLFRMSEPGERSGPWVFYARRLLRTLPAYFVVLALYFAVPGWREQPTIQPLWQFLTFSENWLIDASQPRSFSHVWSLCVEEQFYLVAPLIVSLMLVRPRLWKAVTLCAVLVVAGMILRGVIWTRLLAPVPHSPAFWHLWIERMYYPTWTRLDGLICGMVFAAVRAFRPGWWAALMARANLLGGAGLAGVAVSIWLFGPDPNLVSSVIGYPLLSLSMAALVAAASSPRSLLGARRLPGAGLLAAMAYSLYLSHKAALHLVGLAFGKGPQAHTLVADAAYVALILTFGALLHFGVERPFLKLRDRWFRPVQAAASPPALAQAA